MTKTHKIMGAILITAATTVCMPNILNAQTAAQVPTPNIAQSTQTYVQGLLNSYKALLTAANKAKGYDPNIYKRIVAASNTIEALEKQKLAQTIGNDVNQPFKKTPQAKQLADLVRDIQIIENMKPKTPETFPGKCATFREHSAKGNVQLSGGKWKVTLCFAADGALIDCIEYAKVKSTSSFRFAENAGTINGDSIEDRPPTRGEGTVYFTETPTEKNAATLKVQCFNPAG